MFKSESTQQRFTLLTLKLAGLLAAGYLLGSINDAPLVGVLIISLLALLWHLFNISRYSTWLNRKEIGPIPYGSGPWPSIFARTHHIRSRATSHKNRFSELSQANLRLVESLPNAAYLLDQDYLIVGLNEVGRDFLGNVDDPENKPITNFLRQPELISYLDSDDKSEMVTITSPRQLDRTFQCVLSDFADNRRLLQLIDVTTQIKAMQIREDFVANASHELRTPVTVLKGYLDAFEDDDSMPRDLRTPIKAMTDQVDRMQAIISDLLALNVLESSGPASTEKVVDMPALIQEAHMHALKSELCPETFTVNIDCVKGVLGSESGLHSVVSNLISNAMRFTAKDGTIAVSWEPAEPGAKLIVKDTGIGISGNDLKRVTERFYRTDRGRASHQFGTGLGLAIVKHALASHDVELQIDSEVGTGSTFTCHFPAQRISSIE